MSNNSEKNKRKQQPESSELPERLVPYRRTKAEADADFKLGILDRGPGYEVQVSRDPRFEFVYTLSAKGKWKRHKRARRQYLCDSECDIMDF